MYQTVKYRQRYNWTHRDLLRKAHPKAGSAALNDLLRLDYPRDNACRRTTTTFTLIHAYEQAKKVGPKTLAALIRAYTT